MVGYLWGQIVMLAIPEEEVAGINWNPLLHWFIPLAVGLGRYLCIDQAIKQKLTFLELHDFISKLVEVKLFEKNKTC